MSEIEMTYIYSLSDPETKEVRYIGKSDNPESRVVQHMSLMDNNEYKAEWIKSLISKGLEPIVEILEEVPKTNWKNTEKKWVKHFRKEGANLTNLTYGSQNHKSTKNKAARMIQKQYGVVWDTNGRMWNVFLDVCGITLRVGSYENEDDAITSYIKKMEEIFGDFQMKDVKRNFLVEKFRNFEWERLSDSNAEEVAKLLNSFGLFKFYKSIY